MKNIMDTFIDYQTKQKQIKHYNIVKSIQKIIQKYNPEYISQNKTTHQYCFIVKTQDHRCYNMYLTIIYTNDNYLCSTKLNYSCIYDRICESGLVNIIEQIRIKNNSDKYNIIYEIKQKQKSLIGKFMIHPIGNMDVREIINLLIQRSIANLIECVDLAIKNKIQIKTKQMILSLVSMVQIARSERQRWTYKQPQTIIKEYEIDQQEKEKRKKQLSKYIKKYEQQIKQKYKNNKQIFRAINIVQENREEWKNDDGKNSTVEKYFCKYNIKDGFKIQKMLNKMNFQSIQSNLNINQIKGKIDGSLSMPAQNQSKEIINQSFLIKKRPSPNQSSRLSFEIEKKILANLRNRSCSSINNYYCIQKQTLFQVQSIYSDYISHRLNYKIEPRKFFRVLTTFCQGLVFLKSNQIIHRDLKPDNILLSKDYVAKIIDFGSACHTREFDRRKAAQKVQSKILMTNSQYNLRFSAVPEELRMDFPSTNYYEAHPLFDIYAFGRIIEKFACLPQIKDSLGHQALECYTYLSKICQQPNPDDRPDPQSLYVFLKEGINRFFR